MTVLDVPSGAPRSVEFDFCVGADGSYSVIRRQMMKVVRHVQKCFLRDTKPTLITRNGSRPLIRMDFQQEYLRDEYIEFKMPAGRDSKGASIFLLDPEHLHIWPRHSFMFIALPNKVSSRHGPRSVFSSVLLSQDKSFTCTLFAPTKELDPLVDSGAFVAWFRKNFPDALELIGEDNLASDWARNPRSSLICTKVYTNCLKRRGSLTEARRPWPVQPLSLLGSRHSSGRRRAFNGSILRPRIELRARRCASPGQYFEAGPGNGDNIGPGHSRRRRYQIGFSSRPVHREPTRGPSRHRRSCYGQLVRGSR